MASLQYADVIPIAPKAQAVRQVGNERYRPDTGGRVVQVFLDADMRNGHEGLAAMALERQVDVEKLLPGQYVVFVNHARDRFKVFATDGIVAYKKLATGQKFDLRVVAHIPKAFNGSGKLDYDAGLKDAIEEALKRMKENKKK